MLRVESLTKNYLTDTGIVEAVKGVSFQLQPGEFYTLLGPSGCGKTTTLRCVAGLEEPNGGEIYLGDRVVFSDAQRINEPSHKRDVGMVFQSYAIWPHMNVFDNVAFPLTYGRRRVTKREIRKRVMSSLELVQMGGMESRPAPLLSGGQQQRVALARALVYEPKMLLLDEPLSNLDAKLRTEMRLELKALVERLGLSTLYVTHDQIEALSMSDRIGVMHGGSIIQEGTAREIYLSPRSQFIATFIGNINVFTGQVVNREKDGDMGLVRSGGVQLTCCLPREVKDGDTVDVGVRPETIEVYSEQPQTRENVFEGIVEQSTFIGDALECKVRCGDKVFQARTAGYIDLKRDDHVFLHLPPARCIAISFTEDSTLQSSSSSNLQASAS